MYKLFAQYSKASSSSNKHKFFPLKNYPFGNPKITFILELMYG